MIIYFVCFSPCSPAPSAKAPRSSESPTTSSAPKEKPAAEALKDHLTPIESKHIDPELNPKISPALAPLIIETELKSDCIPSVNIIPSSPLPSRHQISCNTGSETIDKIKPDNNEELKLITTLEKYIQQKRSAASEVVMPVSDVLNHSTDTIKEAQSSHAKPGPVIMKIEHIDDNNTSATNIQATEQFPVVTRRFIQLPSKILKETTNDDDSPQQAQNLPNAQSNVAPDLDLKCETSESNKNVEISGGEFPEQPAVNANAALIIPNPIMPNE